MQNCCLFFPLNCADMIYRQIGTRLVGKDVGKQHAQNFKSIFQSEMSANEFSSVDDELSHFKNRYLELKEEFDEMVSMNREYEAEMEQQVVELEQKEKTLKADNMRITQELEQYRSKHREKEQNQDSEISRLKKLLEEEIQMKVEFKL